MNLSRGKITLSIFCRSAIVTLLLLFLATPLTNTAATKEGARIFLVDVSESINEASKEVTLESISNIMKAASGKWYTGVALFAGDAIMAEPLSKNAILSQNTFQRTLYRRNEASLKDELKSGLAEYKNTLEDLQKFRKELCVLSTDISKAIKFAKSAMPSAIDGKIYVVTDGYDSSREELTGKTLDNVYFIKANYISANEILVKKVVAPLAVKYAEPFDIKVQVSSNYTTKFSLSLTIDDVVQPLYTSNFRIDKNRTDVFTIPNIQKQNPLGKGIHTLKVFLKADGDTEKRNDTAVAVTYVISAFKSLIVTNNIERSKKLQKMLSVQDIDCEIMPIRGIYDADLSNVDCIILDGLDEQVNDYDFVKAIGKFINDGGGTLVMCNNSDAIKGSKFANLEKILPVTFSDTTRSDKKPDNKPEPPSKKPEPKKVEAPAITLLFVIDKSGSMAGTNIALAKEACIAAAETLSENDYVGVLAFDVMPYTILDVTPASKKDYIERQIMRLYADGGTDLYPALVLALEKLRGIATPIKHMIVLSDGLVPPADFEGIVKQIVDSGVTITTVCVGSDDFDATILSRVSSLGNGRFLFTSDFNKVPQIFVNETKYIMKGKTSGKKLQDNVPLDNIESAISDFKFTKEITKNSGAIAIKVKDYCEVLDGIDSKKLPKVERLLLTKPKPTSVLPLVSKDDQPVLAVWQESLGKSAVWTADLPNWWRQSSKFFAQLVRFLSSKPNDLSFADRISMKTTNNRVDIFYKDYEGAELQIDEVSPNRQKLNCLKISSDTYKASFDIDQISTIYEVLVKSKYQAAEHSFMLGCGLEYYPELSTIGNNEKFFDHFANDGKLKTFNDVYNDTRLAPIQAQRTVNLSYIFLILALLILPLDVFLHRKG